MHAIVDVSTTGHPHHRILKLAGCSAISPSRPLCRTGIRARASIHHSQSTRFSIQQVPKLLLPARSVLHGTGAAAVETAGPEGDDSALWD